MPRKRETMKKTKQWKIEWKKYAVIEWQNKMIWGEKRRENHKKSTVEKKITRKAIFEGNI